MMTDLKDNYYCFFLEDIEVISILLVYFQSYLFCNAVRELFPDYKDYTDVYDGFNLLGE